ncbi:MAG: zinc ribbon domain-containing protein [Methanobrevibacter sp.]|nr:zinc ribbon domain-containing protein [Methanobrevibacter sp.]
MGISLNIDVKNENEFNQQLQMYLAQGYSMQSNFNGTAILKKKSYSMGVLIVLIIFFFPAAIIYYLAASEDVVTINNTNGRSSSGNANVGSTTESFDSYCEECGQGLFKDSKFCPGCGKDLTEIEDEPAETVSEENTTAEEVLKCKSCGTELSDENKFCPNCGESVGAAEE